MANRGSDLDVRGACVLGDEASRERRSRAGEYREVTETREGSKEPNPFPRGKGNNRVEKIGTGILRFALNDTGKRT